MCEDEALALASHHQVAVILGGHEHSPYRKCIGGLTNDASVRTSAGDTAAGDDTGGAVESAAGGDRTTKYSPPTSQFGSLCLKAGMDAENVCVVTVTDAGTCDHFFFDA